MDAYSLKQAKSRFDDRFNAIAYSVIDGDIAPINTKEHLEYVATMDFTALKADMRISKDGVIILCHDPGFTLDENNKIIPSYDSQNYISINDLTAEECFALEHRDLCNGKVCHPTDFETYLRICKKYGKIAFITLRVERMDEILDTMFPIIDKYSMRHRCIMNSGSEKTLRNVRNRDEDIMLSFIGGSRKEPLPRAHVDLAVSLGNCVVTDFCFPNPDGFALVDQSLDALEYAHEKDIRVYAAICRLPEALELDRLLTYGFAGGQMRGFPK